MACLSSLLLLQPLTACSGRQDDVADRLCGLHAGQLAAHQGLAASAAHPAGGATLGGRLHWVFPGVIAAWCCLKVQQPLLLGHAVSNTLQRAFSHSNAPSRPPQNHFPERLGRAVSYKPPMLFNILWRAVSPFVDPHTRDKLVFLSPSSPPGELGTCSHGSDSLALSDGASMPCVHICTGTWPSTSTRSHLRCCVFCAHVPCCMPPTLPPLQRPLPSTLTRTTSPLLCVLRTCSILPKTPLPLLQRRWPSTLTRSTLTTRWAARSPWRSCGSRTSTRSA